MAPNGTTNQNGSSQENPTHTQSQLYLSTRGEDVGFSFEEVVLKGLASDGGLYVPIQVPRASSWESWRDLSFSDLAYEIMSLYISPSEIPPSDLKDIISRNHPLVHLQGNHYLLELFHGPTFAFKDVALQFLGNLFEYFLVRKNEGKTGTERHHLTVVGATSGDTGSAAIYGLRGKKDVSVFIMFPEGRVSPIQQAQMTTVPDKNVYNLAVNGTFDDCQVAYDAPNHPDIVKALFADEDANKALNLGAVNSINWARILAQIVYYFYSYFTLAKTSSDFKLGDKVRFVVPTGNFGDVLAGFFALRMGLPIDKLVIATNENDILDRFWKSGKYEKKPVDSAEAGDGLAVDGAKAHPGGVKETLSPAMDILVSSNFERLLWFLAYEFASSAGMDDLWNQKQAGQEVAQWLRDLKQTGAFGPVYQDVLKSAKRDFESERVTDDETIETIRSFYRSVGYILDPHTAVGAAATQRSIDRAEASTPHISLSTAHPAKFSGAVEKALKGEDGFDFEAKVLPPEFIGLEQKEQRVTKVENDWQKVREHVKAQVAEELA
ncbi:Threonine synthase [Cladobotryum mycophilum]|uniref:threonine synthase n=1 Tax=Cladobotryum mycophilum TaxID=491253 RepID=A0ABR0SYP8_9HYPO